MKHRYRIRHLKNSSKEHTLLKTIFMFLCLLTLTSSVYAASVSTDKTDYVPGDSVVNIGNAFQSNEDVSIVITHLNGPTPAIPEYEPWIIPSDLYGDFETYWIVPDTSLGETLLVTATGQTTGSVASTTFRSSSTKLELSAEIPDVICPGETIDVCAILYEKCKHNVLVGLEGREILFFVNEGNCGANVGQVADAYVNTDVNGQACASITIPSTPGDYSIKVKFLGEDKPDEEEPPNSVCVPGERKKLSAANDCETTTADPSLCNAPPVCNIPADQTFSQCAPTQVSLPVSCSDPDGNLATGYPMKVSGPGSIVGGNWVYTPSGDETAVVTIRCQDDLGAYCEATFSITFNINSAPVITCPADITINCNDSSDPTNTGSATATDDNGTPTITYSDSEAGGACPQEKVITRTWTATDGCNVTDQCQQIITVVDNTAPVITCPADLTVECDESTDPLNTGSATATDNCDASVTPTYTDVTNGNVITRTWTATDDCNNSSTCDQLITIDDTTPPVITCPADLTIQCDQSTDPSNTGSATATDNCDVSVTITFTDAETAGSCPQEKVITRTWVATDDANNSATCDQIITVEDTTPPVITCPADLTIECDESTDPSNTGTASATDNCSASVTPTYTDVTNGNVITRTWTATDDCGNSATCDQLIIQVVLVSGCPKVTISTELDVLQGHYRNVSVSIENATYEMGGYDFLIAYDASVLSFMNAEPVGFFIDCNWEYFTYRTGAIGNCGNACPSGVVRIFALAQTNDGYNNPTCYGPPANQAVNSMFFMRFFITNDRTYECQFAPIVFHWDDCGDNSISGPDGDKLYIDKLIYDFTGSLTWDEDDDDEFPEDDRVPFVGAPDYCLDNPMPGKPTAIRCIDFQFGGIKIVCADDIDDRGDLNLNGISNEIADAIVFTNYFIYGRDAFVINAEGQIAASDVNADGIPLSVADLVYIIRVINGDVLPIDKIVPYETTVGFGRRGSVVLADADLGAAAFVFEGKVEVELTEKSSDMQIKSSFDGENTRVVVYSFESGAVFSGEILRTEGRLMRVEASDYFGNLYKIGQLPGSFALTAYPNPFNPSTIIEMTLPIATDWTVDIFNVSGQKVGAYSGTSEAGLVKITWDAIGQSSGIYFIKAQAGSLKATKKVILLK